VTRARAQASALAARLRELGASVVEAPAIRTRSLDASLPDVGTYDVLCVTSPNGVAELFARLGDVRALAGVTVAAIGPGTARALKEGGIVADVVPSRAVAEGLVDALGSVDVRRALVVRGRQGRDVLPDALRARGASVDVVALYETVPEPVDAALVADVDYVTFTSASTVRYFLSAVGRLDRARIVSIGPATTAALREAGLEPHVQADPHTPDGLISALLDDAR
jgi:uroporphyrinogen III methyltransferase/synthase